MSEANRIQHFLFTNNLPTGLNYQTSVLLNTLYHEGAEYPFLPNLPLYTGKYNDEYPGGFAVTNLSGSNCDAAFTQVYREYETNLGTVNRSVMMSYDKLFDDYLNCLVDWSTVIGNATGVIIITDILNGTLSWALTYVDNPDRAIPTYNSIAEKIKTLTKNIQEYFLDWDTGQAAIEGVREDLETWRNFLARAKTPEDVRRCEIEIEFLKEELIDLLKRFGGPKPTYSQLIINKLKAIISDIKVFVRRFISTSLTKIASAIGGFIGLSTQLIKSAFSKIGTAFVYVSAGLIVLYTKNFINCLIKMCETVTEALKTAQANRLLLADTYYNDVEGLIRGGCCSINPCGSGSGSSSGLGGVGLNLLMGNKYIPVQLTDSGSTVAPCGFKSNCPPMPNCTLYGKINGFTETPESYVANIWLSCTETVTSISDDRILIASHKCACGWEDYPENSPCTFGNTLELLTAIINSIPGIGTSIGAGAGTVGL